MNWISLSPAYGSNNTITTELDQVRVTVNTASLAVGTNSGLVYISESGPGVSRLITVPVTVTYQSAATASSTSAGSSASAHRLRRPWECDSHHRRRHLPTDHRSSECDVGCEQRGRPGGLQTVCWDHVRGIQSILDAGRVTSYKMALPKGVTYFFSITAYDRSGNESSRSTEVSRSIF